MSFTLILFFPGHFHTHTITHGHDQQWDLLLIYMTCLLAADSFKFNKSLPFRTPRPHLELLSDTRMVSRARIAHTVRKKSTIWAAQWSALQISPNLCSQFVHCASYLPALACVVQNARANFVANVCQWSQIACGRWNSVAWYAWLTTCLCCQLMICQSHLIYSAWSCRWWNHLVSDWLCQLCVITCVACRRPLHSQSNTALFVFPSLSYSVCQLLSLLHVDAFLRQSCRNSQEIFQHKLGLFSVKESYIKLQNYFWLCHALEGFSRCPWVLMNLYITIVITLKGFPRCVTPTHLLPIISCLACFFCVCTKNPAEKMVK